MLRFSNIYILCEKLRVCVCVCASENECAFWREECVLINTYLSSALNLHPASFHPRLPRNWFNSNKKENVEEWDVSSHECDGGCNDDIRMITTTTSTCNKYNKFKIYGIHFHSGISFSSSFSFIFFCVILFLLYFIITIFIFINCNKKEII